MGTVCADAVAEGVETFRVDLSGPSGAAIAYGQATGRIHDPGNLRLYPANQAVPSTSTGTAHVVLDVSGYFE